MPESSGIHYLHEAVDLVWIPAFARTSFVGMTTFMVCEFQNYSAKARNCCQNVSSGKEPVSETGSLLIGCSKLSFRACK